MNVQVIIRFGYVAMSVNVPNASPSKTMTATQFAKLDDREAAVRKLERIAEENLHNTLRLLRHNRAHDIRVFRFSSRFIPLIGHEMLEGWDPFPQLAASFAEIGSYVRDHDMRVGFHPDHYTVLSTPREEVLRNSVADLDRHVRMLELMGLDERAKCNIHAGGTYGNKKAAAARFTANIGALDARIRHRLTFENDDKTFTAAETLSLCETLGIPMVLDLHHHWVNSGGESAVSLWPRIQATWRAEAERFSASIADTSETASAAGQAPASLLPPKIHISSPKSGKDIRAHADYIDPSGLLPFLRDIAESTDRLDVMIEAKEKDGALFRLMKELDGIEGVRRVDQASVEIGRSEIPT